MTVSTAGTARKPQPGGGYQDAAGNTVTSDNTTVVSFVNTIPTTEGGTHVAGFERAMTKVTNDVLLAGTGGEPGVEGGSLAPVHREQGRHGSQVASAGRRRGFGPEDRVLFRMRKDEEPALPVMEP